MADVMSATPTKSRTLRRALQLSSALLLLAACEKQSAPTEATAPSDAGVDRVKAVDPDLAQAMAQASARPRAIPGTAQTTGGPPANGVFAPQAADKEIERGQAPKITLGSEGSEPRVSLLLPSLKPGSKQAGTIAVTQQSEGSGLPVEFSVSLEVLKPKEAPKTDEANKVASAPSATPVELRVTGARLSVAGAPREVEEGVAKLKGAKVDFDLSPNGAGTNYRYELPKGADPELGDVVRALTDVMAVVTLPRPDKPVGVGGMWMATSRDSGLGLDLVTYRLVKVTRIDGNKVSLSVNTKRYSASSRFDLPGLPPEAPHTIAEFQALADGTLDLDTSKVFPTGGSQNSALGVSLQDPKNPQGRGNLEIRTRADLRL